jgi:hypothetical protein
MVVLRPVLPPPSQPFSITATLRMPKFLPEVVGGGEAVAPGADHDHVVARLGAGEAQARSQPECWRRPSRRRAQAE